MAEETQKEKVRHDALVAMAIIFAMVSIWYSKTITGR